MYYDVYMVHMYVHILFHLSPHTHCLFCFTYTLFSLPLAPPPPPQKDRGIISLSKILWDVEELRLRRLKLVTSEGIQSIASKSLKYLNLRRCDGITDAGLIAVIRNCPNIERLNVCELHKLTDSSLVCVAQTLGSKLVRDRVASPPPKHTRMTPSLPSHHPALKMQSNSVFEGCVM